MFTIPQSDLGYPDTNAALPLSGYLSTEVPANAIDQDAEEVVIDHSSVEQVIAHDQTITGMYLNFGKNPGNSNVQLNIEATLMVSAGGTEPVTEETQCTVQITGDGPTTNACSDWSVSLAAGDVAFVYIHAYLGTSWATPNVPFYGTVSLSSI